MQRGFRRELHQVAIALFVFGDYQQMIVGIAFGRSAMVVFFTDVELAADDWLNSLRFGGIVEMHCTEHVSVVGHSHGLLSNAGNPGYELFDIAGSIEERIVR